MTLKQQVDKIGYKLSNKITLFAQNKRTGEIYSIVDVTNGIATLRSEYNAKEVPPMKLDELYRDYLGINETETISI
tara:strand:+ start:505 stop:732 length:228 start_codon:yes stop_codon:yes gene_type:complete